MKKYILLALLSVICLVSFSQPVTQRGTTAVTVQDARLYAQFNFKPPVYEDTTAANLQKGIDSCGSLIFVKATSQYFYRACNPKKWVPIVGGSNNTVINYESRIVSGSAVWRTGMIYDVTFCTYIIGGVTYTSSPTFVTLATADSSNPRIDVIYLDTLGNVGVLTGNPSPDPVKPVVNPLSQIELTHINVSAQGSTPTGVSSDIIYNENLQQPTEWNTSITAGTLNPNYTTNPYIGTKSFLFNETAVGQSAGFSYGSNSVSKDSVRLLSFYLRQNSIPQTSISIDGTINPLMIIRLYNDGAVVSGDIGIRRGFYGYERDTINKYQLIAIDLSTIPFANDVQFIDSISVTMFSNIKLGFQIDYMRWQFGGGTPPPTLTNFWSLDGNDIADKPGAVLGTTSKNPLSIVVNGNEVMNLDLENQVNLVGNVPLVTDTTAYKPLVINTSGTVAQVGNWGTAGVSQVTGVAPVFSSGGTTPAISMSIASSTTDGYLTQTDWTTFNGKISPADTLNLSARIDNNYDSIVKISDTSFYLRKANGTTKDTVLFGNAIVYTENPIMARVSNDSNIIYFNPDTAAVWRAIGSAGSGTNNRIAKWYADTLKNSSVSDNDTIVTFTNANSLCVDAALSRSRIYANSPYIQGTATSGDRITLGTIGGNVPSTTNEVIVGIGDVGSATGTKNALNITGRLLHNAGSTQEINFLNILPVLLQTGTSTNKMRGLYYNPTFGTSFGGSNIAMQTTSGDVILNQTKTRSVITDSVAVFHNDTLKKAPAIDTSVFQRKNIAAYSFMANNTNAAANVTDQVFKDSTYKNLTSTITYGGTTPPTTALNTVYKFVQIGKMVIAYFFFNYTTSSTGLSSITFDLPSDMPAPSSWGITPAASSFYQNAGYLSTRLSLTSTSATHNNIPISFRRNSGNTGWEIFSNFASSSIRVFYITLNYFTD